MLIKASELVLMMANRKLSFNQVPKVIIENLHWNVGQTRLEVRVDQQHAESNEENKLLIAKSLVNNKDHSLPASSLDN